MSVNYTPVPSVTPYILSDKFQSFIVGPVGCLAGNSLVMTEYGPTPIADITQPTRVLSWNAETSQFQLSQSSVSFPKGTDYLYRVVTPEGEFDAAGSHLLLCADGEYRRVRELRAGDVLAACLRSPAQTTEELCQSALLSGAQSSTKKPAGCSDGYEASDRLHGLLALFLKEADLASAPPQSGVQTCTRLSVPAAALQSSSPLEELFAHIHLASHGDRQQIGDSALQPAHLRAAEGGRTSTKSCGYAEGFFQGVARSPLMLSLRQRVDGLVRSVRGLVSPLNSPSVSTTDRPIVSITRRDVKQVYWDIQVDGTHNYVTVDGAVHHNSTKTTASLMKIPIEARKVAACTDGIRRSRVAVVRNTRQMLLDSTIKDFLSLFPEGQAGVYHRTELRFTLRFDDVECDVMFRGLDDANDVRRLLSLQLSFAMVDEVREINSDVFDALTGRVGRYPNGMMVPHRPQWGVDKKGNPVQGCVDDEGNQMKKVWGATNPPDLDSHWEQYLTNADEDKVYVTIQPSGLSDEADWVQHLASNYYEDLCEGKSEDWIDVYIHGKWGKSLSGMPVYDKTFAPDFHVAKENIKPIQNAEYPITIGIDFGRTPSAVFMQRDPRGRVLVLSEITSENMGIETFITTKLNPHISNTYQGFQFVCAPDPAGFMKQQLNEMTLVDALKNAGFKCVKPPSNDPDKRIAAVERLLAQQLEGKAMFLIDPRCSMLIKGFRSGYRYKVKKNGEMEDKPDKNEWSHVHDANQYACAVIDMNIRGFGLQQTRREVKRSAYAYT